MTGSGKTTLVTLLSRMYPVEQGLVFIDDVDVNDWSLTELRRQIGFVTQEPFLFSDTMADNIRFGRGDAPIDDVLEAAEMSALAKDVAAFPLQYDTLVGERGITLSGGQKQRTAIARAMVVAPAILVLDDATSAVDTETEAEIRGALEGLMRGRSTFIIAHRIQSLMNADQILVLEKGRIVQHGSHDELLTQDGFYRKIYDLQARIESELEQDLAGVAAPSEPSGNGHHE